MKTLVIHPKDPTTDFLCEIYRDQNFVVLRENLDWLNLFCRITRYDRIILLGHGCQVGLFDGDFIVADDTMSAVLRGREVVAIWCHAKSYIERNGLTGFYTDMFISEVQEAEYYGIEATQEQINHSNQCFAALVRENLGHPDRLKKILDGYQCVNNPVVQFNIQRLYDTAA
ncbi:MAG: hypothetical protein RIR96_638 [Bacteroidota bacterium]|jgi:hypothetical protein